MNEAVTEVEVLPLPCGCRYPLPADHAAVANRVFAPRWSCEHRDWKIEREASALTITPV